MTLLPIIDKVVKLFPLKADSPIVVTWLGIIIVVNSFCEKALSPIYSNVDGNCIDLIRFR